MRAEVGLGLLVGLAAATGCGSEPAVCGDGVPEGGEACDDANMNEFDGCTATCTLRESTQVRVEWSVVAMELDGFNETCPGVSAKTVQLDLTGAETRTEMVECTYMNTFIRGLAPGDYGLSATLLDSGGAALTGAPATAAFSVVEGAPADVIVDFPFDSFTTSYTGTFYFRVKWAGAGTCDASTPDVVQERIRIERGGAPLAGVYRNDKGNDVPITMDGASPWPCRGFDDEFPQAVKSLAWGPATVVISGLGPGGQSLYEGSFETFIGAGPTNPEMIFDVPPPAPALH